MHKHYSRIMKQMGFNYMTICIGLVIAAFIPFILTRTLSVQEYGVYSIFHSTIQLGVVLLDFALCQYIITRLPGISKERRIGEFISLVLFYATAFVIFASIVLTSTVQKGFLGINKISQYSQVYNYCVFIIFFVILLRLFYSYYLAKKQVNIANSIDFFRNNMWVLALIAYFIVRHQFNLHNVFMTWLISISVVGIGVAIAFLFEDKIKGARKYIRMGTIKQGLIFSLPLIPAIISTWVVSLSDRYMINYFENAESVAIYALPYSILGVVITLGAVSTTILYPYFIEQMKKKNGKQDLLRNIALKYGLVLILPSIFGMLILRRAIITLISGSKYLASVEVVPYLFLFPLLSFLSFVIYQHMLSQHKTKAIGFVYSTAAILNIALNFVLIPILSIKGAAIATVITLAYSAFTPLLFTTKKIHIMYRFLKVERVLIACIVMGIFIYFAQPEQIYSKIITIVVGAIIYFGMLLIMKVFTKEEIDTVKKMIFQNGLVRNIRKK